MYVIVLTSESRASHVILEEKVTMEGIQHASLHPMKGERERVRASAYIIL